MIVGGRIIIKGGSGQVDPDGMLHSVGAGNGMTLTAVGRLSGTTGPEHSIDPTAVSAVGSPSSARSPVASANAFLRRRCCSSLGYHWPWFALPGGPSQRI
jgi:hypothetical protein